MKPTHNSCAKQKGEKSYQQRTHTNTYGASSLFKTILTVTNTYLPHTYDGIGYENKQDYKRLHKGCDCLFSLFKPG